MEALAGHEPQIVLESPRAGYVDAAPTAEERAAQAARGIHVHPIDLGLLRKAFPPRQLVAAIRGRHGRVRAVVAHLGKNAFRALALGAVADVPVLAIFHGEDANLEVRDPAYRELFERWYASPGAVALGVADHLTRKVVAAGFPAERAHTLHLAVDLAAYRPRGPHEGRGPLRLALSGRLMEVKGHATAFEALAAVRKELPGSSLHLFGRGPLEASLRELARSSGLADAVHFHGAVPVEVLRAELAATDVLLQPSEQDDDGRVEGVPNSILEAMALGLPVVATRHGGIPEAVVDGETGRLVPEHAPESLARAVLELADPALRERFGRAGRAKVEAEFGLAVCGGALAAHIDAAVAAYRALPRSARRAAWHRALAGHVELPEAIGRRERWRWPARLFASWWRGALP